MRTKVAILGRTFIANISVLLVLAAAIIFIYAGFALGNLVGLIVLGVVLLLLAYLLSPSDSGGGN